MAGLLPHIGSIHGDLYARALGYATRAATRVYDPDRALLNDPEVYERMRQDAVVSFCMDYRKRLAAGFDYYLIPEDPSAAGDRMAVRVVNDLLAQLNDFAEARYHLAEGIMAGSSWEALRVERRVISVAGLPPAPWYVVNRMVPVDKRRFRRVPVFRSRSEERRVGKECRL